MGLYSHVFGVFQGSLADLLALLAAISMVSWIAIGVTVALRFIYFLRYRYRARLQEDAETGETAL